MINTPPLPEEMGKVYDAQAIEQALYDWWEAQGYFQPKIDPDQEPFVISMPPPNVTGALHLGHAITAAVEDALIRYYRLTGRPTLWVPGSDHAGIATQNVVERELAKEGITRHDLGREKFVERVWEWKKVFHERITNQHRRLGVSCDWTRERFTLDEGLSRAVREAFVRLYERGLIYRGAYLVNWCPRCGTAISDLEVEHEEQDTSLWFVRYWTEDRQRYITVATTRPETILGDTAVAVHPEDERFKDMIGAKVRVPFVDRLVPIIADEAVDPSFGTGAVKVTPAHDPTDYEMGQRHHLPMINVMNDDMTMNANAGPYEGQDRFECRKNIVQDLQEMGDLVKIEPYHHSVGVCQRCDTIVEPRISTQWFVRMKPLAEPALEAVRDGRIRIVPERFAKVYYEWMENIRDWCISRQLWWGHRIPVWYCENCDAEVCSRTDVTECPECGGPVHQDEDVLDTWFSSALWPFSTLGWPEETEDLAYFYPTSVMETGYDILFFWVARMIMMGLEMTGEAPFHTVYLHGLIRNEEGKKISKSMPDAWRYDPLYMIDEYGQDALRFTLLTGSTPGNDMKLSPARVESNRNFANKIWQAARFVLGNLEDRAAEFVPPKTLDPSAEMDLADRWILSRYHGLVAEVRRLIESFQLGEAGRQLYEFLWGEFCDWYIEMTKVRLRDADQAEADMARRVLVYVLQGSLHLLHPYMPFTTEAIWQYLPHQGEALIVSRLPEAGAVDAEAEEQMGGIMELIRAIRNARSEYDVEPARRIAAVIVAGEQADVLRGQAAVLELLARVDGTKLRIERELDSPPAKALTLVVPGYVCYLPLADLVDLEKELARLNKELADLDKEIARTDNLLNNQNFVSRAPADVVQKERDKRADYVERREKLQERLTSLA
ncbi:MAG: valine--tRNA ligase [Chloroflexi bacterium]|jgi:valyl-tRNA synthetase|nr:valine--tRNA ligase [Chloroflexota bacterium]